MLVFGCYDNINVIHVVCCIQVLVPEVNFFLIRERLKLDLSKACGLVACTVHGNHPILFLTRFLVVSIVSHVHVHVHV